MKRNRSRLSPTVVLATTAMSLAAFPALSTAAPAAAVAPKIAKIAVSGTTITVSGSVTLAKNTAKERGLTRVLLVLTGHSGAREVHTAKINARRVFKATWKTKLSGSLTLAVRVTLRGRNTGKVLKRTVTVKTPPTGPQQLVGTFKLDAGAAPAGQGPTGTYFEMLQPTGAAFPNPTSPASNKNCTPLTPGTDGGLRTTAYQAPPSPAFAGGSSGGALASAIIQPVSFQGVNFSVVTAQSDPQVGTHDALPSITAQKGSLSGEITAWSAQWNGQSFNQGTPKPDGTVPSPTTPLSGTYNSTTHKFTLTWTSRIVGGPFNGFAGYWHLAGTFVAGS
jgi:hypothetical protein